MVTWKTANPADAVIETETPLTSCDTDKFCYSGPKAVEGTRTDTTGKNVFISFKPC